MYQIEGQKVKGKFNTYDIVKVGASYVAKIGKVEKFKSADLSKLLRAIKKREDQIERYLDLMGGNENEIIRINT